MGVCRYWKPDSWKNWWVAYAKELLTRMAAPICIGMQPRNMKRLEHAGLSEQQLRTVFVRGRRWAMPLRNSSVCRFFCSGYFSASQPPISSTVSALSSIWSTCKPVRDPHVPVWHSLIEILHMETHGLLPTRRLHKGSLDSDGCASVDLPICQLLVPAGASVDDDLQARQARTVIHLPAFISFRMSAEAWHPSTSSTSAWRTHLHKGE